MGMEDIHQEVLRVFADACTRRTAQLTSHGYCPAADVYYESATDEVVVRFELPGVERDEITLLVDSRQIVVKGERGFPVAEGRSYQQVELDYGPFERSIRLGADIDPDKAVASYDHGILEVRLALVRGPRGACKINIQTDGEE